MNVARVFAANDADDIDHGRQRDTAKAEEQCAIGPGLAKTGHRKDLRPSDGDDLEGQIGKIGEGDGNKQVDEDEEVPQLRVVELGAQGFGRDVGAALGADDDAAHDQPREEQVRYLVGPAEPGRREVADDHLHQQRQEDDDDRGNRDCCGETVDDQPNAVGDTQGGRCRLAIDRSV